MEDRSCRQEADNGYPPRMAAGYLVGIATGIGTTMSNFIMLLP
ncbi:MAG: hypothetical protein Q4D90_09135 [bacterium]|nr:hypothetical protein [bacterium]